MPIFPIIKATSLAKVATIGSRSLPMLSVVRSRWSHSERIRHILHRTTQIVTGSVVVFSVAAVAHSVDKCPRTGRIRLLITSPDEDIEIGNRMSHAILSSIPRDLVLPSSHPLTRVCQRIVDRIALSSDLKSFNIILISDSNKNAFSLPNGDIVINAGLIGDVKNEHELAGLLSHEIAHAILRHSSEVVSLSDLARIPSGFLYSAVAASGAGLVSGLFRWMAVEMAQPERLLVELPTSRRLEGEADRVGIDLMAQAGYDPVAIRTYWERQPESENYVRIAASHPNNADRLADITEYVKDLVSPAKYTENEALAYWIGRISDQINN